MVNQIDERGDIREWIEFACKDSILSFDKPAASAGQNQVLVVLLKSNKSIILRCGPPSRSLFSISGIAIRKHLRHAGVNVPQSICVSEDGQFPEFGICEIMEKIEGDDLELVWPSLSNIQAVSIAREAAGAVQISYESFTNHDEHVIDGLGLCRWGASQPCKSWYAWCDNWTSWVSRFGIENGNLHIEFVDRVRAGVESSHDLLNQVTQKSAKVFIFDVAERNVMVKDDAWSGLVDQDIVMVGDRMIAPSLARVSLERLGVPWAKEYSLEWTRHWSSSDEDCARLKIYNALFAIQMAAKGGRLRPDGKTEPHMNKDTLEKIVNEMESA